MPKRDHKEIYEDEMNLLSLLTYGLEMFALYIRLAFFSSLAFNASDKALFVRIKVLRIWHLRGRFGVALRTLVM